MQFSRTWSYLTPLQLPVGDDEVTVMSQTPADLNDSETFFSLFILLQTRTQGKFYKPIDKEFHSSNLLTK